MKIQNDNEKKIETHYYSDEIWENALREVKEKKILDALNAVENSKDDFQAEKDSIKYFGKVPSFRTADGRINKKYVDYILRRDFGLEPDSNDFEPFENFSWGGLTGVEAYIAKLNCE